MSVGIALSLLAGASLVAAVVYLKIKLLRAESRLTSAAADLRVFQAAAIAQREAITSLQTQLAQDTASSRLSAEEIFSLRAKIAACATPTSVVDRLNNSVIKLTEKSTKK